MTIQMNPAGPQYLMLLMVATVLVLLLWIAVRAIRHRSVKAIAGLSIGLLAIYSGALLGTSLVSVGADLRPGDTKCFDEWCVTLLGAQTSATTDTITVRVRLADRGLRAQKSVLAKAFIESGGRRWWPTDPEVLQTQVPGGGSRDVDLVFEVGHLPPSPRLVVTEAASGSITPGLIVIGDESSPFHPLVGWPISVT